MIRFVLCLTLVLAFEIESMQDTLSATELSTLNTKHEFDKQVVFKTPFKKAPTMVVSITDIGFQYLLPAQTEVVAINVAMDGFTLRYLTGVQTTMTSLGGSWMAYVGTELVATEMEVNSGGEVAISGGEICLVFVRGVSFAKATKELGFAMGCKANKLTTVVQAGSLGFIRFTLLVVGKAPKDVQFTASGQASTVSPIKGDAILTSSYEDPTGTSQAYYMVGFSGWYSVANYDFSHFVEQVLIEGGWLRTYVGVRGSNTLSLRVQIDTLLIHIKCMENCKVCGHDPSGCVRCDIERSFYLNEALNKCICNYGYFQLGSTCELCSVKCETCVTNQNNCLTCKPGVNRQLVTSTCICQKGYYDLKGECAKCQPSCQACEVKPNRCLECNVWLNREINVLDHRCMCKPAYFENAAGTCESCSDFCIDCTSKADCKLCDLSLNAVSTASACHCKPRYFKADRSCLPCLERCDSCHDNIDCLTCKYPNTFPPTCMCPNQDVMLENGACKSMVKYFDIPYEATQDVRMIANYTGYQQVIDFKVYDVPAYLYPVILENSFLYHRIKSEYVLIGRKPMGSPVFIQSRFIDSSQMHFVLNSTRMLYQPDILIVPHLVDTIFSPPNRTISFEFLLDFSRSSIPPEQLKAMQSLQFLERTIQDSAEFQQAIKVFQYIGIISLLVNSPQAIGQLVFLDGLEPLNVYLTQVILGRFSFRCEFGSWSYNGMQYQNYTLLFKYNVSDIIMENIHKLPKFRKSRLTNNFLFNTILEQIIIVILGLTTFIIRFSERKKTYFDVNLAEGPQPKHDEHKNPLKRTIARITSLISFKIQTVWFILNESYLAWILTSLFVQLKAPTTGHGSVFGRAAFAYAFVYLAMFGYMYISAFTSMQRFYNERQEINENILNLKGQQAHKALQLKNNESTEAATQARIDEYQQQMNHIETKFLIQYSYFVRNTSMPSRYHFFSSTFFFWKKVIFTGIIVFGYGMVYLQLASLMIICSVCLVYKVSFNPYNDRYEWIMSSLSDLMFVCALGSKFNDYATYQAIFLGENDSIDLVAGWITRGWITVAFELACLFLNLMIIFGEIIINIRFIGQWVRRRCGMLWGQDDDHDEQDDEEFYRSKKNKSVLTTQNGYLKMNNEVQNNDAGHAINKPHLKALTSGMKRQSFMIGKYFKFIVVYRFKPPGEENEGYGQYILKFVNLYDSDQKFFILKNLRYKLTSDVDWRKYPEPTILLYSSKERQIILSFSLPYELPPDGKDDRVMEVDFLLCENSTVNVKVFGDQQLEEKMVQIILVANLTKVIQLKLLSEYDAVIPTLLWKQWYTGQNLGVAASRTERHILEERIQEFWNLQGFIKVFNKNRSYFYYLGKYTFHYIHESNLQQADVYVNTRLFGENQSLQITIEFEPTLPSQHQGIVGAIAQEFAQAIVDYLLGKQIVDEQRTSIVFHITW